MRNSAYYNNGGGALTHLPNNKNTVLQIPYTTTVLAELAILVRPESTAQAFPYPIK